MFQSASRILGLTGGARFFRPVKGLLVIGFYAGEEHSAAVSFVFTDFLVSLRD